MVGMDCPLRLASPSPINLTLTTYPLLLLPESTDSSQSLSHSAGVLDKLDVSQNWICSSQRESPTQQAITE